MSDISERQSHANSPADQICAEITDLTEGMSMSALSTDNFAQASTLILEQIGEAVIIASAMGDILLFNHAAKEIFGGPTQFLNGCAEKYQLYLADKKTLIPRGQMPIEQAIRGIYVDDTDVLQRLADGSERWLRGKAFPIKDKKKEVIAGIFLCRNRTTEVKLEEKRLNETMQERLQIFAEAIPQVSWMAEPDGNLNYFNQRWFDISGLNHEESEGYGWEKRIHPDDLPLTLETWAACIATGEDYEVQHRIVTIEGDKWMMTRAKAVHDVDNKIICWFGTCTDIDEQKLMMQQLEKTVADLNARTSEVQNSRTELRQLAHTISNELQSQMKTINSVLGLLSVRYKGRMGEDADRFIGQALVGSKAVERNLDGLCIYSQIEKAVDKRQHCKMNEIFERAKNNVQDIIEERQATITADKLPEVSANAAQVEYVFQQLLENSITFSSGTPKIHCTAKKLDNSYVFSIEDKGIGFDMMDAERIFAMFFRLNKSTSGTGMGLTICRRIVEAHGGRMWAKSSPNEGTVIYFTLH